MTAKSRAADDARPLDPSQPLANARWERFVQNIVKGMRPGPAYEAAGYKATANTAKSAGNRLLTNVDVRRRVAWLQAQSARDAVVTKESITAELTEVCAEARLEGRYGAVVAGLVAKARVNGLITNKVEAKVEHEFKDTQTADEARANVRKIFGVAGNGAAGPPQVH